MILGILRFEFGIKLGLQSFILISHHRVPQILIKQGYIFFDGGWEVIIFGDLSSELSFIEIIDLI